MGGHFLKASRKFERNKNVVFDCNKNFVHALIWTSVGGNLFFYYTKGMWYFLPLFLPMRSEIGNKLIFQDGLNRLLKRPIII